MITIHPITEITGCLHFQELERRVWAAPPLDVVPTHVLITVIKNGGGVLGAYATDGPPEMDGLVGVAFWWLGSGQHPVSRRTALKACSHVVGVLPAWQGKRVGLQLKLAQRQVVLEQGLTDWMTWTYDPLYRANGAFNLHRLGATCNTYYPNVYGEMEDALNRGVPSDRCQVDWLLDSPHVLHELNVQRIEQTWEVANLTVLPVAPPVDGLPAPVDHEFPADGAPLAIPIPADIAAVRARNTELLRAWRFYLRTMLEAAFTAGYTMVDCVQLPESGWHYILVREYR